MIRVCVDVMKERQACPAQVLWRIPPRGEVADGQPDRVRQPRCRPFDGARRRRPRSPLRVSVHRSYASRAGGRCESRIGILLSVLAFFVVVALALRAMNVWLRSMVKALGSS